MDRVDRPGESEATGGKKNVKLSRVERMKATVPSALVDGKPAEGSFNLQDLLGSASRTSSLTN